MRFLINSQEGFISLQFGSITYQGINKDIVKSVLEFISNEPEENEENCAILANILFPENKKIVEENQVVYAIKNSEFPDGFFMKDDRLYHKTFDKNPIPLDLASKILNSEDEDVMKYVYFWQWCCLNPLDESREDIYNWVVDNDIPILDNGLLLMFRRVVKVSGVDYKFTEAIQNLYFEQRKKKKSTNVEVWEDGGTYSLTKKGVFVGILKEIYSTQKSLGDRGVHYTDRYTGREKYYIGVENRKNLEDVDSNKNQTCSNGYHVGSKGFGYSGFGNTPVACIVNPADTVVTYKNDYGKTRTRAFTIVGILKEDCEWHDQPEIIKEISKSYAYQIERLKDAIKGLEKLPNIDEKTIRTIMSERSLKLTNIPSIKEILKTIEKNG